MPSLPARGADLSRLGLRLPPERMPLLRSGRPLKRWRYVGVYGRDLMLCVGEARVAGMPQRWWAIALPDGTLAQRTTSGRGGVGLGPGRVSVSAAGASIELELGDDRDGAVEVVSPHGRSYIWTRKQVVPARGRVEVRGRSFEIDGEAFVDESAGYHARRTSWRWSAGVGRGEGGERLAWNLVEGVHDAASASERTLWVDGDPRELGPVEIAGDLARVSFSEGGAMDFTEWSAREEHTNRLVFRSDYRQPFGEFAGELPAASGWRAVTASWRPRTSAGRHAGRV
jgi:uncharacterized protein DUF2804